MTLLDAKESKPLEGGPSFSLRQRLFRTMWIFVWYLFAAWTPPPLHGWRLLLLRLFGAQLHPTAHIYSSARIWYPPNLYMDEHACLGPRVNCYCMAPIRFGARAIASQGTHLCAGTHDIKDPDFHLVVKPIIIGADAWIAAEAFIGPGVTIGEGAVIGARTVLFKDAEAGGVYAGNPAQLIKRRIRYASSSVQGESNVRWG